MTPKNFHGFPAGKVRFTPLPEPFFNQLLPLIDDLAELKVTLYALWLLDKKSGDIRYFRENELANDEILLTALSDDPEQAAELLHNALERAVQRGTFLRATFLHGEQEIPLYFLNSPRGRHAWQSIRRGEWRPDFSDQVTVQLPPQKPNIFQLYEEHIGPITPLIADMLREAEDTYPMAWIEKAFALAVKSNARNWRYVESILKRWQEGKHDERRPARDTEEDRRRYVEGEFSDYIKH